jgi:formate-dependent nitrite reductase membrane component NrfD
VSSAIRRAPLTKKPSEQRLLEIRREAEKLGEVRSSGIRPAASPLPHASPEAGYYGLPVLKAPQWTWEVPVYFFVGGAAGAAAVIAFAGNLTHADRRIVNDARWLAAIGGAISPALLISDLGMPSRFLNMLRVFKIQSPMSVGSWTLVAFSSSAAMTAFAGAMRERNGNASAPGLIASAAELFAALSGLVLASYTGVLIGATAIPVWSENVSLLPIQFSASGFATAASLLELHGHLDSKALNFIGVTSSAIEVAVRSTIEAKRNPAQKPLKRGQTGWFTRIAGFLSGPLPLALRVIAAFSSNSDHSRKLRRAAAVSTVAGSLMTRAAWLAAGKASVRDAEITLELPPAAS